MHQRDNLLSISIVFLAITILFSSFLNENYALLGIASVSLLFYFLIIFNYKKKLASTMFAPLFLFLSIFIVVLTVPIFIGYLTNSIELYALEAGPTLWLKGAVLDFIFVVCWVTGFLGFRNHFFLKNRKKLALQINKNLDFKIIILVFCVSSFCFFLQNALKPVGYAVLQSEMLEAWDKSAYTYLSFLSVPSTFFLPSICVLLFTKVNKFFKFFLALLLVIYLSISLLRGSRASLFVTIVGMIALSLFSEIKFKKIMSYGVVMILIIMYLGGTIESYRAQTFKSRKISESLEIAKHEFAKEEKNTGTSF